MSAETVEALWVGPYEVSLPDGRRLTPGLSTCQVGRDEAEASDHWQPVKAKAPTPAIKPAVGTEED